ncbi:hypothetical protein PMIN01_03235 [Paraphaeosphaeria minitans]|uniref:Uncharacterized protein n=1 Tax=Paraphaeosphaeria minitans TaxID=565426 RepID=A0A9P6GLP4_9PLEO|nr:hypothetical protein PMIN01_03235 [Paraphaeosphaeria minitans]
MTSSRHPQPLCSSPPEIFVAPPQPHAVTTSQARILSPMIIIPGNSPITTTLTPSQLQELLPTLHIYIEPSLPSLALLPSSSVSHPGLEQALRWREADHGPYTGIHANLIEVVQVYQALSFLGNKPSGQFLRPLERVIRGAFEKGFLLEECEALWDLRHLRYMENWIDLMVRRLATDFETMVADGTSEFVFEGRLEADEELSAKYAEYLSIFSWIDADKELKLRWKCVQKRMAMDEKRAGRIAKMMRTTRQRAVARLETVFE